MQPKLLSMDQSQGSDSASGLESTTLSSWSPHQFCSRDGFSQGQGSHLPPTPSGRIMSESSRQLWSDSYPVPAGGSRYLSEGVPC